MGLIFSPDQRYGALTLEVPFWHTAVCKCILHGFTSVLSCASLIFANNKVLIWWLHVMAPRIIRILIT